LFSRIHLISCRVSRIINSDDDEEPKKRVFKGKSSKQKNLYFKEDNDFSNEEEYDSDDDRSEILLLATNKESIINKSKEQKERAEEKGVEDIVDREAKFINALDEIDDLGKKNKRLSEEIIFIKTKKRGNKKSGRILEQSAKQKGRKL